MAKSGSRSLESAFESMDLGVSLDDLGEVADVAPESIKEVKELEGLFPRYDDVLEAITQGMREEGFDRSQPLLVWKNSPNGAVLLDGHTRKRAAIAAGLKKVPIFYVVADSLEKAVEYADNLQFRRRNLTDADRLRYTMRRLERGNLFNVEQIKTESSEGGVDNETAPAQGPRGAGSPKSSAPGSASAGGPKGAGSPKSSAPGSASAGGPKGAGRPKSRAVGARELSETLKVSVGSAEKMIRVAEGPEDLKKEVLAGTLSVNQAHKIIRQGPEKKSPGRVGWGSDGAVFEIGEAWVVRVNTGAFGPVFPAEALESLRAAVTDWAEKAGVLNEGN